jgi:hypothetical protein
MLKYPIYCSDLLHEAKTTKEIMRSVFYILNVETFKHGRKLMINTELDFTFWKYNLESFSSFLAHKRAVKAHNKKGNKVKSSYPNFYLYDLKNQKIRLTEKYYEIHNKGAI